ncbi:hypothetical protein [Pseudolysinimonas sp.]|jgi:hypothetical protein|uniref:hypothetical protein n=1 Tax=Pseudolysinimonas sp. TaxID=2680009 RepID=UPI003784F636
MSSTLTTHPPQPARPALPEQEAPRLASRRPNALDKLALRVGLMLITYGRRSYAAPAAPRRHEVHLPDRSWEPAGWLPRPGA